MKECVRFFSKWGVEFFGSGLGFGGFFGCFFRIGFFGGGWLCVCGSWKARLFVCLFVLWRLLGLCLRELEGAPYLTLFQPSPTPPINPSPKVTPPPSSSSSSSSYPHTPPPSFRPTPSSSLSTAFLHRHPPPSPSCTHNSNYAIFPEA